MTSSLPTSAARLRLPRPLRAPTRAPSSGFTLVEVMVALVILATMAGMAWQGVDMIVRSRAAASERVERLLRLQSVLAQWEVDLREIADTQNVPGFGFDGATLRLTRRRDAGVQVVVWSLREQTLMRWAGPVVVSGEALQEAWMHSQQLLPAEAHQLTMLPGVASWQVYVYSKRSGSWSNALSTGDMKSDDAATAAAAAAAAAAASTATGAAAPATASATTSSRAALPDGVRLSLQFGPGSGGINGGLVRDLQLVHP
jgi:general secretion pathway protein J